MWYRWALAKAKKKAHSSAIVALWFPKAAAKKISIPDKKTLDGVEDSADMHITLVYLGEADKIADKRDKIEQRLRTLARKHAPIEGNVSGVGRFFSEPGEKEAFYASLDSAALPEFRQDIVDSMEEILKDLPQTHGFSPHCTLCYLSEDDPTPDYEPPNLDVSFPTLTLAWADDLTEFPFRDGGH